MMQWGSDVAISIALPCRCHRRCSVEGRRATERAVTNPNASLLLWTPLNLNLVIHTAAVLKCTKNQSIKEGVISHYKPHNKNVESEMDAICFTARPSV